MQNLVEHALAQATALLAPFWLGVLTHLWQTTLILLPLFLLGRAMRSAPARIIDLLWGFGLAKLLLPLGAFSSLLGWGQRGAIEDLAGHVSIGRVTGGGGIVSAGIEHLLGFAHFLKGPPGAATMLGAWAGAPLIALTALWGLGVLLCLAGLRRRAGRQPRLLVSPARAAPDRVRHKLAGARAGTGIPWRAIGLISGAHMPVTIGLWRPRILVSRALVSHLTTAELRAILLHEDAHRRRRDPLRMAVQRGALVLLFYYPLIWLLWRKLRATAELVCDAAVLRAGIHPGQYARALARTVELNLLPAGEPAAADPDKVSLLQLRFQRLDKPGRYLMTAKHHLTLATGILLVLAGSALPNDSSVARATAFAPADRPQEEAQPAGDDSQQQIDIKPIRIVKPVYPADARKAGVGGRVVIQVVVGKDGGVTATEVLTGIPDYPSLAANAEDAARQWEFKPPQRDGKPAEVTVQIPMVFKIEGK